MKKYYSFTVIFILLLFSVQLFSQNNNSINDKPDTVKQNQKGLLQFYSYIKSYKSKKEVKADMDTISIGRLRNIAKQLYEVREENAVLAESTFIAECKLSDSLNIQKWKYNKDVKLFAKPSLTRNYLYSKISETLSHNVYPLILADYLLRVKILQINYVLRKDLNYETGIYDPSMPSMEIKAKVLDIIKGDSRFYIGQEITFYYIIYWRSGNSFVVNEECFVPLQARVAPAFHLNEIGLLASLDSSYGRYPIENNMIIDKDNYFGYGIKVPWNTFKSNLLELIKTIKTW